MARYVGRYMYFGYFSDEQRSNKSKNGRFCALEVPTDFFLVDRVLSSVSSQTVVRIAFLFHCSSCIFKAFHSTSNCCTSTNIANLSGLIASHPKAPELGVVWCNSASWSENCGSRSSLACN